MSKLLFELYFEVRDNKVSYPKAEKSSQMGE